LFRPGLYDADNNIDIDDEKDKKYDTSTLQQLQQQSAIISVDTTIRSHGYVVVVVVYVVVYVSFFFGECYFALLY